MIWEGLNGQIRRIVSLICHEVTVLQRVSFADVSLGTLNVGEKKLVNSFILKNIK